MFVELVIVFFCLLVALYFKQTRNWKKYKLRGIAQADGSWPFGKSRINATGEWFPKTA